MKIFVACIVLALAINSSTGCFKGELTIAEYKWSNETFQYCEYQGRQFMSGSEWIDAETCMNCTCSEKGLSCCGIGYYAGIMNVPGCVVVPDHCKAVLLNKNKTALCHE